MKNMTRILFGVFLIAVGVIYGLSALGIADISISLDGWWAFFIIIPCLDGLFRGKNKIGSAIGTALGILLLLAARGYIEFNIVWKTIVPAIIIIMGIKLIFRDARKDKEIKADNEEMAAFCSKELDYGGKEIALAKLGAVFGGAKCNLTNAEIKDGGQIDVFCAFGGVDIIVPKNVNIKVNTFCLFGGTDDKRSVKTADENSVTLKVNGFCLFGGIDIKDDEEQCSS